MQLENKYHAEIKKVIEYAMSVYSDEKVTVAEIWAFLLVLGDSISTVIFEASSWDDEDTLLVKNAAVMLYDEFVVPLDIPGPDFILDPLLRDVMIPGLVEGAVRLAQGGLAVKFVEKPFLEQPKQD